MLRFIFPFMLVLACFIGVNAVIAQDGGQETPTDKIESAIIPGSTIPKELLALDYLQCFKGCASNYEDDLCEPLCLCTVREIQKRFERTSYERFRLQLSLNNLDEGNRIIANNMAKACVAEIERQGIKVTPRARDGNEGEPTKPTP